MQERIDDHEARIKRLEQRQTDEMKAINVNIGSKDVLDQLEKISTDVEELKIDAKAYTGDAAIFKNKVERIESDVSTIKNDMGTLKGDVGTLKTDMEQVKTRLDGHAKYFEEHGRRIAATSTKDDLSQLESRIDAKMSAMETRIIDTMTRLLQQKPSE